MKQNAFRRRPNKACREKLNRDVVADRCRRKSSSAIVGQHVPGRILGVEVKS
ncbi:MAG: hypothetical protein ACI8T1_000795 [Verrucomicrobiales bacterium]|jgi:hypothetical protein